MTCRLIDDRHKMFRFVDTQRITRYFLNIFVLRYVKNVCNKAKASYLDRWGRRDHYWLFTYLPIL